MRHYPKAKEFTGQKQPYPAKESEMDPVPQTELLHYKPAQKLVDKVAIITGGDSGIGRSVAIGFSMEGANVAIIYNENDDDADETQRLCEMRGTKCLVIKADLRHSEECKRAVLETVAEFGSLNILVNNAAYQMAQKEFEEITEEQLRRTFDTNILGYFFMAQAALPYLHEGDSIINTGSIVGQTGIPILIDYSSTKGAIHSFTKSLALNLGEKGIRVNCVVPGPIWTPMIPGTMPIEEVQNFGHEVALARPGQPEELAPAYILLASDDGSFMTGSFIHVTGGKLSSD
ncbi:SDR family oxidoreductase [Dyadobacter arcticus]|uniref:NAD(P)-dependent dehydrogenase (Short-subunit alcohol dehydrogenase family) n=1 Tax=Dyadobacter arcticus TaxID=1078754 RepID=A0ABX0UUH0_9BACT|nr:SDR family oxidoreductase [Dyadobacter arcticus]NIJ54576.1 NAD(P)-dependent dehydrogenase (short-subunit alcohol dehydrogenase family) [Dyadobacter arcticus]